MKNCCIGNLRAVFAGVCAAVVGTTAFAAPLDPGDDAWLAIKCAIDAAEPGAVIELSGLYTVTNPVSVNKAITLRGSGMDSCTIKRSGKGRVITMTAEGTVEGVTITEGSAGSSGYSGSGVYMSAGTVTNCCITKNKTGAYGNAGGVYISGGLLTHCVITNNGPLSTSSTYDTNGAGIYLAGASAVIDTCLIAHNSARGDWNKDTNGFAGGIYAAAAGTIRNCTIVDNVARRYGGGVYAAVDGVVMKNCIIAGNRTYVTPDPLPSGHPNWAAASESGWAPNVSYCLFGADGVCQAIGVPSYLANPNFTDAAHGDYTLTAESVAVGRGDYYDGIAGDITGTPRQDPPDIGCYESAYPRPLTCRASFGPSRDIVGATFSLTGTVTHASPGATYGYYWTLVDREGVALHYTGETPILNQILAEPGDYEVFFAVSNRAVVADNAVIPAIGRLQVLPRTFYVTCDAGATAVFPYARPETAAKSIHDVMPYVFSNAVVVLDAGTHAVNSTISITNSVTIKGAGREATILKGHGKSSNNYRHFTLNAPEATVQDMTLTGGYMYEQGSCVVINSKGGRLINCALVGNLLQTSNRTGGPLIMSSAAALADRCLIACNTNSATGYDWGTSKNIIEIKAGTLRNSIVRKNVIRLHNSPTNPNAAGHIVLVDGKNSRVENCTIVENEDNGGDGCAVYLNGAYLDVPQLYNTIIADNLAPRVTPPEGSSLPNLRLCSTRDYYFDVRNCFFAGSAAYTNSIAGVSAKFINAAQGDYRLQHYSPCRNKGMDRAWMTDSTDVYGKPRLYGKAIDIGAAEGQSFGLSVILR